jgi:hypothetical protein
MVPRVSERVLHGVRFELPEAWDDWSAFRFAPPAIEARLPSIAKTERVAANCAIARIPQRASSLEAQLEAMNQEIEASAGGLKILGGGILEYRGQRAVWEDLAVDYQGRTIQQRHLLFPGEAGTVVLLTLTGDRQQLEAMSKALGIQLPDS